MLKGLEGPLTPGQEEELTIIHNSGQHLLALINDVLDISKINAGKLVLSFDEVDLYELVEDVRATVVALINDKPVVLVSKVDPALPMVRGDPRRVRQILLNLLSNAAKFTEEGVIEVHARLVDALNSRTRRVEPFVEVAVEDTGVGIPRGKLREIFKEFTQVDDSDSRSAGGTGLGLPITKKLVSMHDGHIWVESEVGRGSCFTFTLPVYRQGVESFTLEEEEKCTTS
jgi:signal transduction histidine kinase